MGFQPGQPKPPGSGRKKGTPDRRVLIAREGAKAAIAVLREFDFNPIVFQTEINALMHQVAILRAAGDNAAAREGGTELARIIARLPVRESRHVLEWLKEARDGYYKVSQFAYPKLAQVDIKDLAMEESVTGENRARVEYTRWIIVEPDGRQYLHQPKVIDGRTTNRG
jgi:hypothetical protein